MHRNLELPITKLNIGCGAYPLLDWCNIDSSDQARCDFVLSIPPIPVEDGSLEEIFAGHFLEHLTPDEAREFLVECHRSLKVGGKLGVVVPDTQEILKRYLDPKSNARMEYPIGVWHDLHDLDEVCKLFLYSTAQESHHKWSYNETTLTRLLESCGFKVTAQINRWMDPRITVGAWYQFGLDSVKE